MRKGSRIVRRCRSACVWWADPDDGDGRSRTVMSSSSGFAEVRKLLDEDRYGPDRYPRSHAWVLVCGRGHPLRDGRNPGPRRALRLGSRCRPVPASIATSYRCRRCHVRHRVFADKIHGSTRSGTVHTAIRPIGGALIAVTTLGDASPATEGWSRCSAASWQRAVTSQKKYRAVANTARAVLELASQPWRGRVRRRPWVPYPQPIRWPRFRRERLLVLIAVVCGGYLARRSAVGSRPRALRSARSPEPGAPRLG